MPNSVYSKLLHLALLGNQSCSYSELFWSTFFRIRTEYEGIRIICPYSVRIRDDADQNNSKYGRVLRSFKLPKLDEGWDELKVKLKLFTQTIVEKIDGTK